MTDEQNALERDIDLESSDAADVKAGAGIPPTVGVKTQKGGMTVAASTDGRKANANVKGRGVQASANAKKPNPSSPRTGDIMRKSR